MGFKRVLEIHCYCQYCHFNQCVHHYHLSVLRYMERVFPVHATFWLPWSLVRVTCWCELNHAWSRNYYSLCSKAACQVATFPSSFGVNNCKHFGNIIHIISAFYNFWHLCKLAISAVPPKETRNKFEGWSKWWVFFPEFMGPIVDSIWVICEKICCGGSQISNEEEEHVLGPIPLPGSDPTEASRKRERGARALEERLTFAKATQIVKVSDESPEDAFENV